MNELILMAHGGLVPHLHGEAHGGHGQAVLFFAAWATYMIVGVCLRKLAKSRKAKVGYPV